jgi:hypothetical protein
MISSGIYLISVLTCIITLSVNLKKLKGNQLILLLMVAIFSLSQITFISFAALDLIEINNSNTSVKIYIALETYLLGAFLEKRLSSKMTAQISKVIRNIYAPFFIAYVINYPESHKNDYYLIFFNTIYLIILSLSCLTKILKDNKIDPLHNFNFWVISGIFLMLMICLPWDVFSFFIDSYNKTHGYSHLIHMIAYIYFFFIISYSVKWIPKT